MKQSHRVKLLASTFIVAATLSGQAMATDNLPQRGRACSNLPSYDQIKSALLSAVGAESSGFNLQMWATVVNRDGVVCAVAFSGSDRGQQWPGSRVISAQKANTANAFSLPGLALSTANLYSAVQGTSGANPLGGSLYGLQFSNPVDPTIAYMGNPTLAGTSADPMVGNRVGGVNVFGGGLALYNKNGTLVGAVGLSGDTSCADHNIAWRVRNNLNLDYVPAGVSGDGSRPDNMLIDDLNGDNNGKTDGWEQPTCANPSNPTSLPPTKTVGQ